MSKKIIYKFVFTLLWGFQPVLRIRSYFILPLHGCIKTKITNLTASVLFGGPPCCQLYGQIWPNYGVIAKSGQINAADKSPTDVALRCRNNNIALQCWKTDSAVQCNTGTVAVQYFKSNSAVPEQ